MRGNMKIRNFFRDALIGVLIAGTCGSIAFAQSQHAAAQPKKPTGPAVKSDTVPITTQSKAARNDYEMGMLHREDLLFTEEGVDFFRQAVKADPTFALGHATLAFFTDDPAEGRRERALAKRFVAKASPDERLLIRWMNGTKNGELVPAIAAMNDLLAKYPNDKRLGNMTAEWLCSNQDVYDRGEAVLHHVLTVDPNYFPALNNLAYCYALGGQPNLAPPLMNQYVAALPGQPNPQDSYGEILRMLGDFPDALDHYRIALRIDPSFTTSQLGVASTYALMGDEDRARVEYLKAISMTKDRSTKFDYRIMWAMTYYRENQPEQSRKALSEIAADSQKQGFEIEEAESHRDMALFNSDPAGALDDLGAAQAAISGKHPLSREEHDTELATILQTRAFIGARDAMPNVAVKALEPLSAMAQTSRNNLIQNSYHSANGAVLLVQGKYSDAISELEEDSGNPLSLQLLADAQVKAGQSADAQKTLVTLAAINDERVETAFAVPQARAALKGSSAQPTHAASN